MDLSPHPIFDGRVDQLLGFHAVQTSKSLTHDHRTKMASPILRPSMARMKVGFVDHFDMGRFETVSQTRLEGFSHD